MEGQGRARGRATRGRATRGVPVGEPHKPDVGGGGGGGGHGRGTAPSAWGPPRPSSQPAPAPQPGPSMAQQQPPRPTARGKQVTAQQTTYGGGSGVEAVTGAFRGVQISEGAPGDRPQTRRGAMRGRTEICAPMVTKPPSCKGKQGDYGNSLKIVSNHFRLVKNTDWSLYQYRVDFSPEEDRTRIRKILLRDHKNVLGDAYMFDGTMLFTIRRLTMQPDVLELFSTRTSDDTKIRITIKFTNELALGDYQYIQLFNIILRNCIDALKFQLVGREYFDPLAAEHLRNFNLEIWPGYVTSILQYEYNIMMCIDVSHKVLRKDTVLDVLHECRKRYRDDWQERFTQAVLGAVVFTHYNNKPYRVDDVDFATTPNSTFKKKDQDVKYVQYYREKYQINIRELNQPMLISRPKAKDLRGGRDQLIILVPELCNMTGLTNEMRANFQLMKAVADKTRIPPGLRMQAYEKFMRRMNENEHVREKLKQWNISFAPKLEELTGRRMAPEELYGANNSKYSYDDSGDWARNMRGIPMLSSIRLTDWAVIVSAQLSDRRGQGTIDNYLSELRRAAQSLRFEISRPEMLNVEIDKPHGYHQAIERVLSKRQLQLVMCIVPNNRPEIYSAIKKKCCVDRPVASQVIATKTLTHKNLLSVATKIVIQMNCKLGGAPWYVPIPFRTADSQPDATMVVGFDVCHDTNMKDRSFGAIVASLDYYFSRYYSAVSQHSFGEELSNDIANHICHAVLRFKEINGKIPSKIILYRDGVGDSNIPFVLNHEVKMILSKLSEVFPGVEFKMAVVVVSKRIQTRFFVDKENPKPGTVVDDVITQPEKYDFFLVSQSVRQGTVSPTSYNVIYDTSGLKPAFLQRITYKMTHLYFNCSATVQVPAQVQYAHKLAFLVGQSIHQCPSPDLNNVLYFL